MLNFLVDEKICSKCGLCSGICPARIIETKNDYPYISKEKEDSCYECEHCFTICPAGAISILNLDPKKSEKVISELSNPKELELLIKSRRSIRRYKDENLDTKLIEKLLEVSSYAPTAVNSREVRFTLIDDKKKLAKFRDEFMEALGKKIEANLIPENAEIFKNIYNVWKEKKVDVIFRNAPHMLIASAPLNSASPIVDCVISLSYFEIYAQSLGLGTLWDGMCTWAIKSIIPEMNSSLEIPENHTLGYTMLFGKPAVNYARTAQREPMKIHRL